MRNRFWNRQPQTFKQALPRTVAPVMAASGAKAGFVAGIFTGAFVGAFALGDPDGAPAAYTIIAATTAVSTVVSAAVSYGVGYGGSNLLMAAIPALQNKTSRLLLNPGIKGQFGLFAAVAGAMCVSAVVKEVAKHKLGQ